MYIEIYQISVRQERASDKRLLIIMSAIPPAYPLTGLPRGGLTSQSYKLFSTQATALSAVAS